MTLYGLIWHASQTVMGGKFHGTQASKAPLPPHHQGEESGDIHDDLQWLGC